MEVIDGTVLSEGIALGQLYILNNAINHENQITVNLEKQKFDLAVKKTVDEIKEIQKENSSELDYLNIQILIASDHVLKQKVYDMIDHNYSASYSVNEVMDEYVKPLLDSTNTYLQQRSVDILDVKHHILNNILDKSANVLDSMKIVYTEDLHPSFLIKNKKKILGIISNKGGYSSHSAILCRQLNIPYMLCDKKFASNDDIVIDTRNKKIYFKPTFEIIDNYKLVLKALESESYFAVEHPGYKFLANISDNYCIEKVNKFGFDGVGLYRTEMIFMNNNRPLSFDEQYEIYHDAITNLGNKSICFRTFDIGDDKQLPYVTCLRKGVKNYIDNPLLFKTQIRALLEANENNTVKIMFPMIENYDEFVFLKRWVLNIKKIINNNSQIKIGMMLETKNALEHIHDFKDVDFISIGTNDLIFSVYKIGRDNQKNQLNDYLEDLANRLKNVVEFCENNNIELSVCGELASISHSLRKLMQIGIKNFSVAAHVVKLLNRIYKEING